MYAARGVLIADQPEDNENGRWIQGGEGESEGRRERLKGGRIQRREEKGKGKCAHVKALGRHSPWSRDIFEKLCLPNGEGQAR